MVINIKTFLFLIRVEMKELNLSSGLEILFTINYKFNGTRDMNTWIVNSWIHRWTGPSSGCK